MQEFVWMGAGEGGREGVRGWEVTGVADVVAKNFCHGLCMDC